MAWTNAFDIGACTLAVIDLDTGEYVDPGDYAMFGISISVDPSGVVTFEAPSRIFNFTPVVVMGFDTQQAALRIAGATGAPASEGGYFIDQVEGSLWNETSFWSGVVYDTYPSESPFTPDPLQLSESGAVVYDSAGIIITESGGG